MTLDQNHSWRYASSYRNRCSKADWAGVNIGDAFKQNIEYYLRLQAQCDFYHLVKKVQVEIARKAGSPVPETPRVKPQLSPFYTNYPSILSAFAAIGLTGYLEFEVRVREKALFTKLAAYLKNPAIFDNVKSDPIVYQRLASIVAKCVHIRLLLEDLSRFPSASSVEIYRIFLASQQTMKFRSVPEIINAVILYGDLLPDWQGEDLHPMTHSLLKDITEVCTPFFKTLPHTQSHRIVAFGAEWVKAVCVCLAKYLSDIEKDNDQKTLEEARVLDELIRRAGPREMRFIFKKGPEPQIKNEEIAPLNKPKPPSLFDSPGTIQKLLRNIKNKSPRDEKRNLPDPNPNNKAEILNRQKDLLQFISTIEKAGTQQRNWEDMRSDILERALRSTAFSQSPIQGNPVDGHAITIRLGDGKAATCNMFDRPIELSDDLPAYEKLIEESRPITDALKRTLYPNLEEMPETERFRSSGSIDPSRLATADISSAIFRRYRIHDKVDKRGRPVLLIACDASGSLKENQIRMLKVLTAAWLNSTAKSSVQVVAGLYHSGNIRQGVSGPLIQWIYHPKKTPAISRSEAARTLISLPRSGTGRQSDALSLAFMLDEARQIAQGRMIYLILITDCKWNKSFNTEKTGMEEVHLCFKKAYEDFSDKLHTTLVALGARGITGFENILDKVITVSEDQLSDYTEVAGKIGLYVASCIKERHKWVAGR